MTSTKHFTGADSIHCTGMECGQKIGHRKHLDIIKTKPAAALVHAVKAVDLNAA